MGIEDLIAWIETSVNGSTDTDRLAPPLTSDQPRSGGMHHTRSGLRRGSDCLFPGFLTLACRDLPSEKPDTSDRVEGLKAPPFTTYGYGYGYSILKQSLSLSLSFSLTPTRPVSSFHLASLLDLHTLHLHFLLPHLLRRSQSPQSMVTAAAIAS